MLEMQKPSCPECEQTDQLDRPGFITAAYTNAQRELNQRILRAIASDDEGYTKLTTNGTFDMSNSFGNCGAYIFGDPTNNGQFAWVFAGHHITVRCDGNSEPNAAFG